MRSLVLIVLALLYQGAEYAARQIPPPAPPDPARAELRRELDTIRIGLERDWAWLAHFVPRDEADHALVAAVHRSTLQRRERRDHLRQLLAH